jgi:hypothetical protein
MKNNAMPAIHAMIVIRLRILNLVFRKSGSRNNRYSGAVNCRNIAFADVVNLLDTTKNISIPLNDQDASTERMSGLKSSFLSLKYRMQSNVIAAIRER